MSVADEAGRKSQASATPLTKRELIAAMVMQGVVSNLSFPQANVFSSRQIEKFSVMRADALLAELAEGSLK